MKNQRRPRRVAFSVLLSSAVCAQTVAVAEPAAPPSAQDVSIAADHATHAAGEAVSLQPLIQNGEIITSPEGEVSITGNRVELGGANTESIEFVLPDEELAPAELTDGETAVITGQSGLSFEVQDIADGTSRILSIADESYSESPIHEYEYELNLPEGFWLEEAEDGAIAVVTLTEVSADSTENSLETFEKPALDVAGTPSESGELAEQIDDQDETELNEEFPTGIRTIALIQPAWAIDSNGQSLPSHFRIEGNRLIQVVDTTGAQFPVVSDPAQLKEFKLTKDAFQYLPPGTNRNTKAYAAQTIKRGKKQAASKGFKTFNEFKNRYGRRGGYEWHHIVEQSNIESGKRFDAKVVHHPNNLVLIPSGIHRKCVNSWMNKKNVNKFGVRTGKNKTMRQEVRTKGYEEQHRIGYKLLQHCGVAL